MSTMKQKQQSTRLETIILVAFFAVLILLPIVIVILLFVNEDAAVKILKDHLRHYLIGIGFALIASIIFWKQSTIKQKIIYFFIPFLLAAGWPDIVYFISYIIQHGTVIGVLENKNIVYYLMHKDFLTLTAGPILTGVLLLYDKRFAPKHLNINYWPFYLLVTTGLASYLHLLFDRLFGF